jgi:hypothetical protein
MDSLVLSDAAWERMAPLIIGRLAIVWAGLPEIKDKSRLSYPALLASLGSLLRNEPSLRAACITGFLMFAAFSAMWSTLATLLAKSPYGFGSDTVGAFGFLGIAGLLALWAPDRFRASVVLEDFDHQRGVVGDDRASLVHAEKTRLVPCLAERAACIHMKWSQSVG